MLASLILALRRRQTCAKAHERFWRTRSKAGDDADEVTDRSRRRFGAPLRFSSAILPPYARRSASSAASRLQDDQEPKQVPASDSPPIPSGVSWAQAQRVS